LGRCQTIRASARRAFSPPEHGRRDLLQVPQRRLVVAQHLDLVLGEVADHQTLAERRLAGERRQFTGDGLDQRGLAGAVHAQQADALADLQREVDAMDDGLGGDLVAVLVEDRVAGIDVFHHQQRIRG
jgi:hypothetical protein